MDIRLQQLSYSSILTKHSCPRKFQLYRLNVTSDKIMEDYEGSVTFAFGHVVGLGIQNVFEGKSMEQIIWESFLMWEPDLLADNPKQNKSFWLAVAAVQKFHHLYHTAGYLNDWELVYYEGKPAVELGFIIHLPGGFKYRGFVDAVLRNKITGAIRVLECKTTSARLHPAQYKNSAQAIGYSIVLDHLFPELSSYDVLYLVYKTKELEYEQLEFHKSYLLRALWLQELLLEVEEIKRYEDIGVYPMHGESCYNFYRECDYLNLCTLSTERLTEPLDEETIVAIHAENDSRYQIQVTFEDLVKTQLGKE